MLPAPEIIGALRRELTEIPAAPWIPGVSDASALLVAVPADVVVQFGPLDLSRLGDTDQLAKGGAEHDITAYMPPAR